MNLETSNAFRELMEIRNLPDIPEDEVEISGQDPFFKTPFRIGETAAAALAARAVAANDLWEFRTGRRQKISMELNTAAASCLGGTDQTRRKNENGEYVGIPTTQALVHMVELTQPWKGKGDRWYLPHFNLPHLEKTVLSVLQCEGTPEAVAEAVSKWDVDELDRAITDAHATGGIVYTPEEWLQHPHGKHLASIPVITITKVGESEPEGFADDPTQPLSGIRVLELCRILAGPTCGLGLAEHGAEVLMVTAPQLPQVPPFVRDVSHGKRSAYLDYTVPEQAKRLRELAQDTDIFVEGYVFTQEYGEPMNPSSITAWTRKFSKRHDLPPINPHAFRHTVASVLIANGTDIVTVSKQLGHAQVSTTSDRYSHLIDRARAEAAECIADTLLNRKNA